MFFIKKNFLGVFKKLLVVLSIAPFLSAQVFAQDRSLATTYYHHSPIYVPLYNTELSDSLKNKYYELSVDGFEEYLSDLEKDEPKVTEKLRPELERLKYSNKLSKIVLWSSLAAGTGIGIISIIANPTKENPSVFDPNWSTAVENNSRIQSNRMAGIIVGFGVITGGLISYFLIKPGKDEMRKFVNLNNELSSQHKLKMKNIGFNIDPVNGSSIALNFSF